MKSVGLVSKKTLLSHHPMVTNVLREMQLIEEEEKADLEKTKAEMEIQNAFAGGGNSE